MNSQDDLDAAFAGCTTIGGTILIGGNYTGGFNLSEVTTMNATILVYNDAVPSINGARMLSFIELDNLQIFSGELIISTAPYLTRISMASVTFMTGIQLDELQGGVNLNFPELVNVTSMTIFGDFR